MLIVTWMKKAMKAMEKMPGWIIEKIQPQLME